MMCFFDRFVFLENEMIFAKIIAEESNLKQICVISYPNGITTIL